MGERGVWMGEGGFGWVREVWVGKGVLGLGGCGGFWWTFKHNKIVDRLGMGEF